MIHAAASSDTEPFPKILTGTQPLSGPGVNEPAHVPGSGSNVSHSCHQMLNGSALGSRFERQTASPVSGSITASNAAAKRSDRKSTRLNSSHVKISYAVFCLKKKKKTQSTATPR